MPLEFNQPDTMNLASEIVELRRLKMPLDSAKRTEVFGIVRAFAIEWDVKLPKDKDIDLYDYEGTILIFTELKGRILFKMKKRLNELSARDSRNMKDILSGSISFGNEDAPPTA